MVLLHSYMYYGGALLYSYNYVCVCSYKECHIYIYIIMNHTNNKIYCEYCERYYLRTSLMKHLNSQKHLINESNEQVIIHVPILNN